jgi:hypothetical protein
LTDGKAVAWWADLFHLLAVLFIVAAAFHGLAAIGVLDVPSGTRRRHGLFVLVNVVCAVGLARRPRGFVWFFAALTAQQLYSHGTDAWREWATGQRIDPASAVVLVGMPLVLILLVRDAMARVR